MTTALDNALRSCRSLSLTAHNKAVQMKKQGTLQAIMDMSASSGISQFSGFTDQAQNQRRYALFRGWVYAAVNALAMEAAGQRVHVGKLAGATNGKPGGTKGYRPTTEKSRLLDVNEIRKMPSSLRNKEARTNVEVIEDHPLMDLFERPNHIQGRYAFTYSFVANLCLTGWSFIVYGEDDEGTPEIYSLPTTWVVPDHSEGAFQKFRIVNPANPSASAGLPPLDRSQVAFAYLPNPSDPMAALSPSQAQSAAIKIDDNIQSSQVVFFENSVFPGAIVTMGTNPHPGVSGNGTRPRLTPAQRRQVYSAIKKVMGGVANYGNPAIIDGMIEKIERLSAAQNEIGWEKSEKTIRSRILSAFCVHPFILGEEVPGSYAQAFIVRDIFGKRVNVYLDLLSTVMTNFSPNMKVNSDNKAFKGTSKEKTLIWWEETSAKDPSMEKSIWEGARTRDDVTQNEFRAWMDLPPDDDKNQATINKSLAGSVKEIAVATKKGELEVEQAIGMLEGMGLPTDVAKRIAGKGPSETDKLQQNGQGGDQQFGGDSTYGGFDSEEPQPQDEYADFYKATKSLETIESVIYKAKGLIKC